MEIEGLKKFEQYGYFFDDDRTTFIPIMGVEYLYKYSINSEFINIGYIGRSVYWKITPVIYLLNHLGKSDKKYYLTIVTNNSKLFSSYLTIPENVKVNFEEGLLGDDLKSFILSMDIGFSMGTAALEFSKYGVPTILVDFSNKLFPENYKFRWIFENIPGNLGYDLSSFENDYNNLGKKWDDIIDQYLEEPELISDKCFKYTLNNHSIDKVTNNLYTYAIQSQLNPEDLKGILFRIYHFFYKLSRRLKMRRLLEAC